VSQPIYEAMFEQDETGAWIVDVPSLPGCHTYGTTLDDARVQIREALALWLEADPDSFIVTEDVRLAQGA
jgi:predicted RNase H-like HicB family nuclease